MKDTHAEITRVTFGTHPSRYKHWKLEVDGPVAWLRMDVSPDDGLRPDYKLKMNSYDLAVDIELDDAVTRLRFEHPEVRVVCIESLNEKVFCAGANIFMLSTSTHTHKVNFCKFTNETRINIEEATAKSGQKYVASLNGAAAGGGYELALACDEIHLVDDRSSAVSLPEVPLLGVLPGTGGLTRLVDKRRVRRDIADAFCTIAEGAKARKAVEWGLVDFAHPKSGYAEAVRARVAELAGGGNDAKGITLDDVEPEVDGDVLRWKHVTLELNRAERQARLVVRGPEAKDAGIPADPAALGAGWYALRMWRELRRAMLELRFNCPEIGLITLHVEGDAAAVVALDAALEERRDHWFVRETLLQQGRTLKMIDVTARTFFAIITPGTCFAGSLFEIALAADRSYMLDDPGNAIVLTGMNGGVFPMAHGLTRLENRFYGDPNAVERVLARCGEPLAPEAARELGLVTDVFDDIDWEDEIRIILEERRSLSPDALTGMEANLRFVGPETMESRIYARLSAWQNWIFTRPNAVGERGALTSYGKPYSPEFDWSRV
ncbi:MAG TPA: 2,3-epoxybenzoyl-CoA dihydrolase [Candidatus Krumholzibacteria bacterium]|nr:2,3-epoxybenzoyl-CoA dihydrolase [Candidatus Krumholzibacteria bacterium]